MGAKKGWRGCARRGVAWGVGLWLLGAAPVVADTVVLANGDELEGEVISRGDEGVVLDHPQLGRLTLRSEQLRPPEAPDPGLLGTSLLRGFTRHVELGASGQEGNTQSKSLAAGLRLDYSDDTRRWDVDGRYFFNENRDEDDDNNARFDLRRDWLLPNSRWFGALGGRYQFDRFEAWRHRLTVFGGPGFRLLRGGDHELDVILAPAFTKEFQGGGDEKAEGVAHLHYRWAVDEDHTLSLTNGVFTELAPDEGGLRNLAVANWSIRIADDPGLRLNVGLESEYETRPEDGDKKHDLKYFLTLGLDL